MFETLVARLQQTRGTIAAEGLWGSSAPIVAALCAQSLRRVLLYITSHLDQADEARDDMELVCPEVELFPAFETIFLKINYVTSP